MEVMIDQLELLLQSGSTDKHRIAQVIGEIKECRKKIKNSSEFVDFFIHDILDYSVINKKESTFHV
jgi:hypothetical protein